jgi:hypothetical protein
MTAVLVVLVVLLVLALSMRRARRRRLLAPAPDPADRQRGHPSPRAARRRAAPRRAAGWTGGMYSFMRGVLATSLGHALYRQRQITIEPSLARSRFNRAIKRFQRRGSTACRSEWRLIAATHNLLKLHNHRLAAATL